MKNTMMLTQINQHYNKNTKISNFVTSLSYKQLDIAAERINEVKHSSLEKRQRDLKNVNRADKVNKPKLCLIIL